MYPPQPPREPPPRQALMPRAANRQDRQQDAEAGKVDDARPRPDSSAAANGVYVSRVPSFQSKRPAMKIPSGTTHSENNRHS